MTLIHHNCKNCTMAQWTRDFLEKKKLCNFKNGIVLYDGKHERYRIMKFNETNGE